MVLQLLPSGAPRQVPDVNSAIPLRGVALVDSFRSEVGGKATLSRGRASPFPSVVGTTVTTTAVSVAVPVAASVAVPVVSPVAIIPFRRRPTSFSKRRRQSDGSGLSTYVFLRAQCSMARNTKSSPPPLAREGKRRTTAALPFPFPLTSLSLSTQLSIVLSLARSLARSLCAPECTPRVLSLLLYLELSS